MPQMYARCNNFTSGATSAVGVTWKYIAISESEDEVRNQVYTHMDSVHNIDGKELTNNIKRCIFTRGTKVFGTRGHGD